MKQNKTKHTTKHFVHKYTRNFVHKYTSNFSKFWTHLQVLDNISYTVYNCPNTEQYRVNKIHIGRM